MGKEIIDKKQLWYEPQITEIKVQMTAEPGGSGENYGNGNGSAFGKDGHRPDGIHCDRHDS